MMAGLPLLGGATVAFGAWLLVFEPARFGPTGQHAAIGRGPLHAGYVLLFGALVATAVAILWIVGLHRTTQGAYLALLLAAALTPVSALMSFALIVVRQIVGPARLLGPVRRTLVLLMKLHLGTFYAGWLLFVFVLAANVQVAGERDLGAWLVHWVLVWCAPFVAFAASTILLFVSPGPVSPLVTTATTITLLATFAVGFGLWGFLVMPTTVAGQAERIAGDDPYCLQASASPVEWSGDLSPFAMFEPGYWGSGFDSMGVISPLRYHGLLVIARGTAPLERWNWSYRSASFEPITDWRLQGEWLYCEPRPHYAQRWSR